METTDLLKTDSSSSPSSRQARPKAALLRAEPPLLVLPSIAQAVGLNEAIVLQQLHYLLANPANGRQIDGRQWIFNTLGEWVGTYFPFWCVRTLRAIFQSLETKGYVLSCQPEGRISRRKYYTLDHEALQWLAEATDLVASKRQDLRDGKGQTLPHGKGQTLPHGKRQSLPLPSTETSAETTAEISSETSQQRIYKKESAFTRRTVLESRREMAPDADCGRCGNALDFIKIVLGEGEIGSAKRTVAQGSPVGASGEPEVVVEGVAPAAGLDVPRAAGATADASGAATAPRPVPARPPATTPVVVVYARPTAPEWARFMRICHPDLTVNPGWDWCQSFHAECHAWLQETRTPQEEMESRGE